MLGKPKFNHGDEVTFIVEENGKKYELLGNIYIIDSYGTFYDNSDVSYDIMVKSCNPITGDTPCLFKHIREDRVNAK